jgi:tetratricopeptide (TPR) repeat protein
VEDYIKKHVKGHKESYELYIQAIRDLSHSDVCFAGYALLMYDMPLWIKKVMDFIGIEPRESVVRRVLDKYDSSRVNRDVRRSPIPGRFRKELKQSTIELLNREFSHILQWLEANEDPVVKEKYLYHYVETTQTEHEGTDGTKLLFIFPGSAADFIYFTDMFRYFRKSCDDCRISLLVHEDFASFVESNLTGVDEVIPFKRMLFVRNRIYSEQVIRHLRGKKFQSAFYPAFSRDVVGDFVALECGAEQTSAFQGEHPDLPADIKNKNDLSYSRLIRLNPGTVDRYEAARCFSRECSGIPIDACGRPSKISFPEKASVVENPDILQQVRKYYLLGSLYKAIHRLDIAGEWFERVIEEEEDSRINAGAYFHMAEIALMDGDNESGIHLLEKCLDLNPDHMKAKEYLLEYQNGDTCEREIQ